MDGLTHQRTETIRKNAKSRKWKKVKSDKTYTNYWQNFMNYQKKDVPQYFYLDTSLQQQATSNKNTIRISGGGGIEGNASDENAPTEIFYDCAAESEKEENMFPSEFQIPQSNEQLQQFFRVFENIKDSKEFLSILKELAYTSQYLYSSFKRAYRKSKAFHKNRCRKCEYCLRKEKYDLKYVHNNLMSSEYKRESEPYNNEFKNSASNDYSHQKDKKGVNQLTTDMIELNLETIDENNSFKDITQDEIGKKESDILKSHEVKWIEEPTCLIPTFLCEKIQNQREDIIDKPIEKEISPRREPNNKDQASQTLNQNEIITPIKPVMLEQIMETNPKSNKTKRYNQDKTIILSTCSKCLESQKMLKAFNVKPITIIIKPRINIASNNYQSDTEIVEIYSDDSEQKLLEFANTQYIANTSLSPSLGKPHLNQMMSTKQHEEQTILSRGFTRIASDIFYSCNSSLGTLDMGINQTTKKECFLRESFEIAEITNDIPLYMIENFTEDHLMEYQDIVQEIGAPIPVQMSHYNIRPEENHQEMHPSENDEPYECCSVKHLSDKLLREVIDTLERTTIDNALKDLKKDHIPPTNLKPKEKYDTEVSNLKIKVRSLTELQRPLKSQISMEKISESTMTSPGQISKSVQTDVTAIIPTGHYKRNDIRLEIRQNMQELLQSSSPKYQTHEKEEILLDLYKLLHPKTSDKLSKEIRIKTALQDVKHLLKRPHITKGKPVEVAKNISDNSTNTTISPEYKVIQNLSHVINPKLKVSSNIRKYSKDIKDKILEKLQIILMPTQQKIEATLEVHKNLLSDLHFMLDTGEEIISEFKQLQELQLINDKESNPNKISTLPPTNKSHQGSTTYHISESDRASTSRPKSHQSSSSLHSISSANASNSPDDLVKTKRTPEN